MKLSLLLLFALTILISSCATPITNPTVEKRLGYRKSSVLELRRVIHHNWKVYLAIEGKRFPSSSDNPKKPDTNLVVGTKLIVTKVSIVKNFDVGNRVIVWAKVSSGEHTGTNIRIDSVMKDRDIPSGKLLGVNKVYSLPQINNSIFKVLKF